MYENEFSAVWQEWLKDVATSKALTLLEPEQYTPSMRIGQARFISRNLAELPDDNFITFPQGYGRHTTLAGIWMFLEKDHKKEYLITAFGKRKGRGLNRPACFYGCHISHGSEHNVNFSLFCIDYFQKHIAEIDNAEILVCHNHPRSFVADLLSQIIDWSPLPSNTDRETMYQFKYRKVINWLASDRFRNIRFFLVEDLRLREIQLPPVARIAQFLNWLETQTHTQHSIQRRAPNGASIIIIITGRAR